MHANSEFFPGSAGIPAGETRFQHSSPARMLALPGMTTGVCAAQGRPEPMKHCASEQNAVIMERCRLTTRSRSGVRGGQFIAHAMPLDVASSGATPAQARDAVDEAVRLFLTTSAAEGTLTEVLEDAGYRSSGHSHIF